MITNPDYPRFREAFAEVMDLRLYSIEWLDDQIARGLAFLWSSPNAAIVAEIKTFPTGAKAIHGLIAAGDLGEITDTLIPAAEHWAKAWGCVMAVIESREGWSRQLKSYGYSLYQTAVVKQL